MKPAFNILYLKDSKITLVNTKDVDIKAYTFIIYTVLKARLDPKNSDVFRKLPNTNNLWEINVSYEIYDFRLLGFWSKEDQLSIAAFTMVKSNDKTPKVEIDKVINFQRLFDVYKKSKKKTKSRSI